MNGDKNDREMTRRKGDQQEHHRNRATDAGAPGNLQDFREIPPDMNKQDDLEIQRLQQVFIEETRDLFGLPVVPVTTNKKLRTFDVKDGFIAYRIIEQNPSTNSKWAALAASGRKVAQIVHKNSERFLGVVVLAEDGKPDSKDEFRPYAEPTRFELADVEHHSEIRPQAPSGDDDGKDKAA